MLDTATAVAPAWIETQAFPRMGDLPHFNPDDDFDPLAETVVELRAAIAKSGAVLICTPEYAGALPGAFKNLLEWTVGGEEMYRRPIAWINASGPASPDGGAGAHESLRKVLGYTTPTSSTRPACASLWRDRRSALMV